jgi:predicted ATP-grasp superfamily ATP-dependent carboligase
MTKRILLTGGRAPATLDLARMFHHAGATVFVAESCKSPVAKGSIAVRNTFHVPEPKTRRRDFIDALIHIIQQENIDLVIPTCEEVFYISEALDRLTEYCQIFTDQFPKLAQFHSKWIFSQLVQDFKITAPETHLIQTKEQIKPWLDCSREWVFKPVFSRFAAYAMIQPEPTQLHLIQPTSNYPWVAQRYIPGTEYSTYSVAKEGRLLAHITYNSPYRAGKGSGIYFVSDEQPEILAFTEAFVQRFSYTGQLAFDFRKNSEGQIYVLECNPRATSGIHLFSRHDQLPRAFLDDAPAMILPKRSSKKMLGLIMPIYGLQSSHSVSRFLQDMFTTPDTVFSWEDPIPFFYQLISFAEILRKSLTRRVSLMQAATADLEWDGD